MSTQGFSRRYVLKTLATAAALAAQGSRAADAPKLDVHDPAAVKLGYVENAKNADAKKFPQYAAGSTCDNCLQLQGKPGNEYRPCTLFQGKLVAAGGWCSGWTAEM